jgi:hypothetical protein
VWREVWREMWRAHFTWWWLLAMATVSLGVSVVHQCISAAVSECVACGPIHASMQLRACRGGPQAAAGLHTAALLTAPLLLQPTGSGRWGTLVPCCLHHH